MLSTTRTICLCYLLLMITIKYLESKAISEYQDKQLQTVNKQLKETIQIDIKKLQKTETILKKQTNQQTIENKEDKDSWKTDPEYDNETSFVLGDFFLGVPSFHVCSKLNIKDGRFVCAVNTQQVVTCFLQCKMDRMLKTTGYKEGASHIPDNRLTDFGIYRCNPETSEYWTDNDDEKLTLNDLKFGISCELKEK